MKVLKAREEEDLRKYLKTSDILNELIGLQLKGILLIVVGVYLIASLVEGNLTEALPILSGIPLLVLLFTTENFIHFVRLKRQERVMGFNFNGEMEGSKITLETVKRSDYWFDSKWFYSRGIMIHTNYLKQIKNTKTVSLLTDRGSKRGHVKIIYETIDGAIRSIVLPDYIANEFTRWFKKTKKKYHLESKFKRRR